MTTIVKLQTEMEEMLQTNILPYWEQHMQDTVNGGFYGRIDGHEKLYPHAPKGGILHARLLWTYSSAYRLYGTASYLSMATRAKRELIDRFYDTEYGGVYWSLDPEGRPLDTKKQIYLLGFAIYGLSEYHRATRDTESLHYAKELFHSIENHSFDHSKGGYLEAFTRTWGELSDVRLSEKDDNERKTMNTHLHILEPYTNLYRIWKDPLLEQRLRSLILLFLDKIISTDSYHLGLFFDEDWQSKSPVISYGHDIEASWLLHEAAIELGDVELLKRVEAVVPSIVQAACEGWTPDGGMKYEYNPLTGETDGDRHWWVQAETIVGLLNLYHFFGDEAALEKAEQCWTFTKQYLIDHTNGEWHWSLYADGTVNMQEDKAGFWKCPYHNGRMAMMCY